MKGHRDDGGRPTPMASDDQVCLTCPGAVAHTLILTVHAHDEVSDLLESKRLLCHAVEVFLHDNHDRHPTCSRHLAQHLNDTKLAWTWWHVVNDEKPAVSNLRLRLRDMMKQRLEGQFVPCPGDHKRCTARLRDDGADPRMVVSRQAAVGHVVKRDASLSRQHPPHQRPWIILTWDEESTQALPERG